MDHPRLAGKVGRIRHLQRGHDAGRHERRLAAARGANHEEEVAAAQAVHGLVDLGVAAVEAALLGGGEGLHAGVGAGRRGEDDALPMHLQLKQIRVGGVRAQRRRQQAVQPHAFVAQRPPHQVMADVAAVAPLHRHHGIKAEAQVALQPRHHHLVQSVKRKCRFQRRSQACDLAAAQRTTPCGGSGQLSGAHLVRRWLGGCCHGDSGLPARQIGSHLQEVHHLSMDKRGLSTMFGRPGVVHEIGRVARTPRAGWPSGHTRGRQHGHVGVPAEPARGRAGYAGGPFRHAQNREPHPGRPGLQKACKGRTRRLDRHVHLPAHRRGKPVYAYCFTRTPSHYHSTSSPATRVSLRSAETKGTA